MSLAMKLNSLPQTIFDAANPNGKDIADTVLRVNSAELSRNDIITSGRLVACEWLGNRLNESKRYIGEKYTTRLNDAKMDYATLAKMHADQKFMFCATMAYREVGKEPPKNVETAKKDIGLWNNSTFWRTAAAIDRDVLDPIFFNIFDSIGGRLLQWEQAPIGRTTEIEIRSNDVFIFEDSSWGSGRSTTKNYLYSKSVTLTPKAYSCNATIKWYQDVVNGDPGRYYAALYRGMWNKVYAILMSGMKTAVASTDYVPSGLTFATYTSSNWLQACTLVAAVNGVTRNDLMAIGTAQALSNVLPTDGTGGAIAGLQYGLGEEWFTRGFMPNCAGVDLLEVAPVVVPGTQNSTLDTIDTGESIFILPKGGVGYAPMYGVYAEGTPITLVATPSETANFTIDINVGAFFDIKPVFASKVGVITDAIA